ncbi:MAG TPA: lytic transglycosylase domain-containing protein [Candidatus Binataceae bacterium]|jgi:soluble lytic murein transglycosylase-like protein|nr:lytic transglycosylase domain-containing protein [Candidatus Binataceae bacterium]
MLARTTIAIVALLCVLAPAAMAGEGSEQRAAAAFMLAGWAYGIDPELLQAIAQVESSGNADAVSPAGALGLMQLMPTTAAQFGVADPFDPAESIVGAARVLSYMRQDPMVARLPQLLAAYNAGPGAVSRYGGVPPYQETREYIRRVLWWYLAGTVPPPATTTKPLHPRPARLRQASQDDDSTILQRLARIRAAADGAGAP